MTLGRCPLSIFCSRGTPPRANPRECGRDVVASRADMPVRLDAMKSAAPLLLHICIIFTLELTL